jgi:DNA-binding GntR family transcriptional regulator
MTPAQTVPASVNDVVEHIESDIIFGRLRPNQELIEDALMARFQAKRHIVRSALRELTVRRLVTNPPSRSARVKDFTAQEVREIYHMRALLQRDAAHIMPLPVPVQDLAALKEVHVRHAAAATVGANTDLIHQLNDEFHDALFDLCQNTELCKAIRFYTEASNPIRSYGIADQKWLLRAIQDHAAMIAAIEHQDRVALETLVVEHMQPTRRLWEARHGEPISHD